MKFEQYPYSLFIEKNTGGGFDENGMAIPPSITLELVSACRDIPSGSGDIITNENGEQVSFSSKVVMPVGTDGLKSNDVIEVKDEDGNVRVRGRIIRFKKMQLHSRLWV